jgi:hypothetical protein
MACGHMWDPADRSKPFVLAPPAFAMAPVDEVFGAPGIRPDDIPLDDLVAHVGGEIVLEGGQRGYVTEIVDDDHIEVQLPDDRVEVVNLSDVTAMHLPPRAVEIPDDDDATLALAPDLQVALQLAQLIIRAGCESVNGTGETIAPGIPPVGYLPADPDLFPVVERAAGLAVAMILELLDADVDAVLLAVGATSEEVPQGDLQTEETSNDAGTSEDF